MDTQRATSMSLHGYATRHINEFAWIHHEQGAAVTTCTLAASAVLVERRGPGGPSGVLLRPAASAGAASDHQLNQIP
eukprot:6492527-Amphidinium_carterae.5